MAIQPEAAQVDTLAASHHPGTLVRAATRTDDVDGLLRALLPAEAYHRLNPTVPAMGLDEASDAQLAELRRLGAAAVSGGDGAARIEALARALEMDEGAGGGGAWPPWRCSLLPAGSFPARVIAAVRSKL